MDDPKRLSVTFDGSPIGHVEVVNRSTRRILGHLMLGEASAGNLQLIEEARTWAKRFDDSHDNSDGLDYLAFDKYIEVIQRLTPRIAFPELAVAVEEFAVDQDLNVEVTLGEAGG